eukprot:3932268-Rhodomonas_salina.1
MEAVRAYSSKVRTDVGHAEVQLREPQLTRTRAGQPKRGNKIARKNAAREVNKDRYVSKVCGQDAHVGCKEQDACAGRLREEKQRSPATHKSQRESTATNLRAAQPQPRS